MAFNPNEHVTKIQGREYLEVKWRQVWFRDVHPLGSIVTEIIPSEGVVVVKATVAVDGVIIATAHGSANDEGKRVVWAGKSLEKAETAAIGRALANAGFGTQFTEDEETNVVDSPVERKLQQSEPRPYQRPNPNPTPALAPATPIEKWLNSNVPAGSKAYKGAIGVFYTAALELIYGGNTHHMKNSIAKAEQSGVLTPDMSIAQALMALANRNESAA